MRRVIVGIGLLVAAGLVVLCPPRYKTFADGQFASEMRVPLWTDTGASGIAYFDYGRLAVEIGVVAMATAGAALLAPNPVKRPE